MSETYLNEERVGELWAKVKDKISTVSSDGVSSFNGRTGAVTPQAGDYTASDVGALPDSTSIPTKTSDLTNDSGFITSESDPTVPSWAKESTKPSYGANEVTFAPSGSLTATDVQSAIEQAAATGGGSGGTSDHDQLSNRDAADQHPVSAITGLQDALDGKADSTDLDDYLYSEGGGVVTYSDVFGSGMHNWHLDDEPYYTQKVVTLLASGWSGDAAPYTQTISVEGVTATNVGYANVADSATDEQFLAAIEGKVSKRGQGDGSLTFKAYGEKPIVDIPVVITLYN